MPPKCLKYTKSKKLLKCFVPNCKNVEGCGKIFLHTPRNPETLKAWCDAVGVSYGGKCCEDHFELSKDADNWQYFKLCGNGLKIRKGVVPHRYLDSMCPDTRSQFTDEDKKIKLEFLNTMVSQRKVVSRVNRIEDLRAAGGASEDEKLRQLSKNNSRTKQNSSYLEYVEPTSDPNTLEVTPDIYLCTCADELPTKSYDPLLSHKFSCLYSSHARKTEEQYYEYVLGPTTDTSSTNDLPVVTSMSGKPSSKSKTGEEMRENTPQKQKFIVEERLSTSESEFSMLESNYPENDPDFDQDPDIDRDEDPQFGEPRLAELKEDIKDVLKKKPPPRKRSIAKGKPVKPKPQSKGSPMRLRRKNKK
ncbi:hypothetical protein GE061_005799 [Apolygus lucorum]|uniref:THAP-type domain-containing protein n=1 Tax=Apolygus lucorum TaxID=248454 RepID=A0A8S9WZ24_APOLU|nr:hypothetical protein GE061_005799 [Apolygus lucorum]